MHTSKNIFIWVVIGGVVFGGIYLLIRASNQPGPLDGFASCLKDKGAIFYGAFWCPHCQNQKAMFGNSSRLLPYVECSAPDGQGQNPVCKEKQITGYPTWIFADGSKESGEVALQKLSEKTGCPLPQ